METYTHPYSPVPPIRHSSLVRKISSGASSALLHQSNLTKRPKNKPVHSCYLVNKAFFYYKKQHTLNILRRECKDVNKTQHCPSFCHFILNKKMYKSAYMVQIMRSKRSIKEEGKEKNVHYIQLLKMQQSRRDATILQSSKNKPKQLRNCSLGS